MIKLDFNRQIKWDKHRSGWNYVLNGLMKLNNENGLKFDGCIDATFGYMQKHLFEKNEIPYKENWIGFLHHPINICPWLDNPNLSPKFVLTSEPFLASVPRCKMLFTLSYHLKRYVDIELAGLNVPTAVLYHPTEFTADTFCYDAFIKDPKVVHIGFWMRKITTFLSIGRVKAKKIILTNDLIMEYLKSEIDYFNLLHLIDLSSVEFLTHLDSKVYDALLAESVVFIDLYDSSANNTIIECIARNTPILVNKLDPVVEYLGEEYPFYYASLDEAMDKIDDYALILQAHQYLSNYDKSRFMMEHFLNSFSSAFGGKVSND